MFQTTFQSPLGPLLITASENGLTSLTFTSDNKPEVLNTVLKQAVLELEQYFNGELKSFSLPLSPEGTEFQQLVWHELEKISFGQTMSYTVLAEKCGGLEKIRAVAGANGQNKIPIIIPCHRVIGKNGALTGYLGGVEKKKWLLDHEGVLVNNQHELF